jgi:acetyltransferase-like isoleucine patch superfamily enzyme
MAYLAREELTSFGFASLGENVQISSKASIYSPGTISIGNNVRIDDNSVLSGNIVIENFVHLSCNAVLTASKEPIHIGSHSTISYGSVIFSSSDDFGGDYLFNPMEELGDRNVQHSAVKLEEFVAVGAGCVILPGSFLSIGTALGAMTLIKGVTDPWSIYVGVPGRKIRQRGQGLLTRIKN